MNNLTIRRLAFLGLFLVVLIAMLSGLRPRVTITEETSKLTNWIDSLPRGSILLVSFDHEASSLPEIRPLSLAFLGMPSRGHKLVGLALMAEGTAIGYRQMELAAAEYNASYGNDWVYLGFKPQYIAAILALGESFERTFPNDYLGTPHAQIPLLEKDFTYANMAGVVSIADGNMPTHWMEYAGARYRVRIASVMTAAMVTTYDPYLNSGQLYALVGGLRGAAEYEQIIGVGGGGGRGLPAQSASHWYIIALILLGNLLFSWLGGGGKADMEFGTTVAGLLTLAILTFLYRDNPIYKFAEYLLVGVSVGYVLVITWTNALMDILFRPLGQGENWILLVPLLLGLMMFGRFFSVSASWSRIPLAIMIGSGAGVAIPAMLGPRILSQVSGSVAPLVSSEGIPNINGLIVLVGVLSTLGYFYFSRPQTGWYGRVTRLGTLFLMIFFGATFGYTVMSRMSTLIGRVEFLLADFLHLTR